MTTSHPPPVAGAASAAAAAWVSVPVFVAALVVVTVQIALVARAPALTMSAEPTPADAGYLVALLVLAAGVLLAAVPKLRQGTAGRFDLAVILGAGLVARLMHLTAAPMLDDDVWRYLWDGLVVGAGFNPYGHVPRALAEASAGPAALQVLAAAHAPLVSRIVAPDLSTIYPAGAQLLFAASVAAFGPLVAGFRMVTLLADALTALLLIIALRRAGQSPALVALFALNPLVILVTANGAHVDAVLPTLLVAAALAAGVGRGSVAGLLFGAAVAVKLWPALFGALLLRSLPWRRWPGFLIAAALVAGLGVLPLLEGVLAPKSGLAAYATGWRANNGFFDGSVAALALLLAPATAELVVRLVAASLLLVLGFGLAMRPVTDTTDLMRRMALLGLGFVLIMPSPYPWYTLPALVFAVVGPVVPALVLTVGLAPAYLVLPIWVGTASPALAPFLTAAAGFSPALAVVLALVRPRK